MGSLGVETMTKKKPMWLYPKILGHNPPERWGHSACFANGLLYIFGGCCGGLHLSDVLTLNLRTMTWTAFATTGRDPGPRDSHTAVLVRNKMIVFGGTNGSHKVNDLHVLDLVSREWSRPNCIGTPPSPRESHTATVVGEDRMVIFGGSGEGEANYLNDLHVLDLVTMKWSSLEGMVMRCDWPVARDSHSAVALANKVFMYGGDSGDRYHGDVDVFDMDTLTWSRLLVDGSSPGARAGHASVTIGSKVYVIGGVGDKHYYNDVWVLDISGRCSWTRLDAAGQRPQGRFSHAAVSTAASDIIAIYGGCGEDERPLSELLVLKLENDEPKGSHNISSCNLLSSSHWSREKRRYIREGELDIKELQFLGFHSDSPHTRRRRRSSSRVRDHNESDQEDLSISSQPSKLSPFSRSDHSQISIQRRLGSAIEVPSLHFSKRNRRDRHRNPKFIPQKQEHSNYAAASTALQNPQHMPMLYTKPLDPTTSQNLIGANVVGKVDGTFDSGLLMTAVVNGKIFRGLLFSPGLGLPQPPTAVALAAVKQMNPPVNVPETVAKFGSDLEGVVLTLGSPGDMHFKDLNN